MLLVKAEQRTMSPTDSPESPAMAMNIPIATLLSLGATAPPQTASEPTVDEVPPIEAAAWVNNYGQAPSNSSLLGRAVLIESWATW